MTKNDDALKEQEPMAEVHKWQKKIEEEIKDLSPKERVAYFKKAGERATAERKRLLSENGVRSLLFSLGAEGALFPEALNSIVPTAEHSLYQRPQRHRSIAREMVPLATTMVGTPGGFLITS